MDTLLAELLAQARATSAWELVAVFCAIAYLQLALLEKRACWYFALISTAIYTVLFWNVSLLMESGLQVYYLLMAVYGWWQWRSPEQTSDAPTAGRQIHTWRWQQHAAAIGLVLLLTALSGTLLTQATDAAWPYLDSFTTWGAVVTTFMVARKVLENWLYWFVIDGLSIYLYLDRGLLFTVGLFVVYEVMVVIGYWRWHQAWQADQRTMQHPLTPR